MATGELAHHDRSADQADEQLPIGSVRTNSGRLSAARDVGLDEGPASPFSAGHLERLDEALTLVSRHTRLRFSIYLGDLGADSHQTARDLHEQLGEAGVDSVLIAVDPGHRKVDIVTGAEARIRLSLGRLAAASGNEDLPLEIRNGDLSVDEATYSAKIKGRVLDLTFKEFELLKYLAQHPGRVFTRAQLLQEVWGYDYFGGTRTVDVHVRRLRAKLGPEHEALIGTVRNVGYRFVPVKAERAERGDDRSRSVPAGRATPASR